MYKNEGEVLIDGSISHKSFASHDFIFCRRFRTSWSDFLHKFQKSWFKFLEDSAVMIPFPTKGSIVLVPFLAATPWFSEEIKKHRQSINLKLFKKY